MYTGPSSDVLCGRTAGCLVCFSSCLWLVHWTEDSLRLENLLSHLCGWEWASAVLTINVLGMTCWLCGNQETKMFRAMNVALRKLAPRPRQKYCFRAEDGCSVSVRAASGCKWVDRNGRLEGEQTRCEVEARPGLLSTASSFVLFFLFFLWISLLMWRLLLFSTKAFYSVSSQPTQVERLREFLLGVSDSCAAVVLSGGTRKPATPRTDKHSGQTDWTFFFTLLLYWAETKNQEPFYWLPYLSLIRI